jgi:putative FmdB family regulatory protein
MPIYEYQCAACCQAFERLQKLSDPDPVDCPACGQAALKRQLSAPSFRLAGSGWYETDFKGDKDKRRNLAGGDDAPPAAKPAEATATGKNDPAPATGGSTPAKPAADTSGGGTGSSAGSGASSGSGSGSGSGGATSSASGTGAGSKAAP